MGQCGVDRQSNTGVARAQYPLLVRPTFEAVVLEEGLVCIEGREETQALLGACALALLPCNQRVECVVQEHHVVGPVYDGALHALQNRHVELPILEHFGIGTL